jgi:uncharacterized membrane protein YbhN (UPF0104 family)
VYVYAVTIPLLLALGLAAALERRVHHALFVLRHGRPDAYRWPPEPRATAGAIPLSPGVAAEHAGSPPGRPARRLLGWALAVAILAGCLLLIDPGEIAAALRHLSLAELAVLLLLATLDRLLMGLRWGVLLRLAGVRLPLLRAVRLFYQASAVGTLLPTHLGGDLLRGWWAVRGGAAGHPVAASLVMERLLGLVSAANWAVLGAVLLAVRHAPGRAWAWAGLGLLAALAGNGLFALSLSRRSHGLVRRGLGRLGGSGPARLARRFHAAYAVYGRDRRGLLAAAGLAVAEHGVQMLLVLAIARSLDVAAGPVVLLAAAALFLLVLRLPLAPDGWGVGELSAVGLLGLAGVGAATAFSVSLVNHAVLMLALAPGLLLLLAGRWRLPGPLGPLSDV